MRANRPIKRQRNRHDRSVSSFIRQGAQTTKKCGSAFNTSNNCDHARTGSYRCVSKDSVGRDLFALAALTACQGGLRHFDNAVITASCVPKGPCHWLDNGLPSTLDASERGSRLQNGLQNRAAQSRIANGKSVPAIVKTALSERHSTLTPFPTATIRMKARRPMRVCLFSPVVSYPQRPS